MGLQIHFSCFSAAVLVCVSGDVINTKPKSNLRKKGLLQLIGSSLSLRGAEAGIQKVGGWSRKHGGL